MAVAAESVWSSTNPRHSGDAEKLLSDLVKRGRKHSDSLIGELEKLVKQARKDIGDRTAPVQKKATQAARRVRKKLG